MLAGAVACVDDGRTARRAGRLLGTAHRRMTQHDAVHVALQSANRVAQRFALGRRAGLGTDVQHRAAQTEHGRLEAARGARGRLVEGGGEHAALQQVDRAHALHHHAHLVSDREQIAQVVARELLHAEHVLHVKATRQVHRTQAAAEEARRTGGHHDRLRGRRRCARSGGGSGQRGGRTNSRGSRQRSRGRGTGAGAAVAEKTFAQGHSLVAGRR
mmetsp:Transcript_335/g.974  ORF Transcript_335/g.974 Transcript_335/m.974 type:complete len:215 (-) Transcript_335:5997-6641(-)